MPGRCGVFVGFADYIDCFVCLVHCVSCHFFGLRVVVGCEGDRLID